MLSLNRVLITGGAGFIGSHLAEELLESGLEVYVIDDLSTGKLENIQHLRNDSRFKGRFHPVIDTIFNHEKMVELVGICDVVIHLAAAVGVKYILDHPLTSITTNIKGTELVLGLANKFRKRILIASTSEVYGKQTRDTLNERDDVTFGSSGKMRWSYAVAKLMDEFTALAYHKTTQLQVVIVRLFNTIGPRQTGEYGMVVPRLIRQALRGDPITVHGDGTQTRTFTHVKEVCRCLIQLVQSDRAVGQVVNVGGTEEVSILELAQRIIVRTGSSSAIKLVPYAEVYSAEFEDMPRRVPSCDLLEQLIGFKPEKRLDVMLDELIVFFRER